ncbi:MAG: AAA family ATPase, partial [Alphaproteobacteria bacterium]
MDLEDLGGFTLRGLERINVVLGKNGCGKSYLLKRAEVSLSQNQGIGKVRYLSPERGGRLSYEAGVEQNLATNPNWLVETRRQNQTANFRQQSTALFRRLEILALREIEREHTQDGYEPRNFDVVVEQINTLLDRVRIERHNEQAFSILERESGNSVTPESISSGEAELISLGIEFLAFVKEAEEGKENIFLVDEPDVHLHPDLQDKLAEFVVKV